MREKLTPEQRALRAMLDVADAMRDAANPRQAFLKIESLIVLAIREAQQDAYEEAARIVENEDGFDLVYTPDDDRPTQVSHVDVGGTMRNIAARLRALKDSLIHGERLQDCLHEWTNAQNEVVKSGEVCLKCGAMRPERFARPQSEQHSET